MHMRPQQLLRLRTGEHQSAQFTDRERQRSGVLVAQAAVKDEDQQVVPGPVRWYPVDSEQHADLNVEPKFLAKFALGSIVGSLVGLAQ